MLKKLVLFFGIMSILPTMAIGQGIVDTRKVLREGSSGVFPMSCLDDSGTAVLSDETWFYITNASGTIVQSIQNCTEDGACDGNYFGAIANTTMVMNLLLSPAAQIIETPSRDSPEVRFLIVYCRYPADCVSDVLASNACKYGTGIYQYSVQNIEGIEVDASEDAGIGRPGKE